MFAQSGLAAKHVDVAAPARKLSGVSVPGHGQIDFSDPESDHADDSVPGRCSDEKEKKTVRWKTGVMEKRTKTKKKGNAEARVHIDDDGTLSDNVALGALTGVRNKNEKTADSSTPIDNTANVADATLVRMTCFRTNSKKDRRDIVCVPSKYKRFLDCAKMCVLFRAM